MPSKLPYMQWYPADWIAATTMLSPASRGIWFDILNVMWQLDRTEKITGTLAEIARAGRCDAVQMRTAINELTTFRVADVTERNGIVTVVCRRFKKANAERVRIKEAVKKSRCNGNVTPYITEDILQKNKIVTEDKSSSTISPKRCGERITFGYDSDHALHGITDEQKAEWARFYPALNIEDELLRASAWMAANPKNRKHDIKRFLNGWLARTQDRAKVQKPMSALLPSQCFSGQPGPNERGYDPDADRKAKEFLDKLGI